MASGQRQTIDLAIGFYYVSFGSLELLGCCSEVGPRIAMFTFRLGSQSSFGA